MTAMDQFILFGDSITQQAFDTALSCPFGAALCYAYTRRLDVINRGLSGYNTTQALHVLPRIVPPPSQAKVRFLAVFFGANDARLPNTPGGPEQHVPINNYKNNLRAIVQHPAVKAHKDIRVILITPPPVEERRRIGPSAGSKPERTAEQAAMYASAVVELGDELKVPVLDLHKVMISRAKSSSPIQGDGSPLPGSLSAPLNKVLEEYLHDGLHFTGEAYRLLFHTLMEFIELHWPDQLPERLPKFLPTWDDTAAWEQEMKSGTSLL